MYMIRLFRVYYIGDLIIGNFLLDSLLSDLKMQALIRMFPTDLMPDQLQLPSVGTQYRMAAPNESYWRVSRVNIVQSLSKR